MISNDLILTLAAFAYAGLLIAATFINNRFFAAFRLDTLFMRNPPAAAKGINLVAGLAIIGYNVYVLTR